MSLPREPRQKMINMMYLVLTALLALNVSSEILNAFKTVNRSLENTNTTVNKSTETIMASLQQKTTEPTTAEKARMWNPKALDAVKFSNKVFTHIQNLKDQILKEAGGDPSKPDQKFKEDNLDIATRIMVEKGEGPKLLTMLSEYKKNILGIDRAVDSAFKNSLPINLDKPASKNKAGKTWEGAYFHMVPTVAALTILSKFQNDVKTTENRVVAFCHEQVGKVEVRFDTYEAIVGQNSKYLMPGEEIEITAGLGAFSKTKLPTVSIGGSNITLNDKGMAVYKTQGGGIGEHTLNVTVSFKDQDGKDQTRTIPVTYTVGQANASIALDKMNVLYIGVDNPVTIAASGAGGDRVKPTISSGNLVPNPAGGSGKYLARVNSVTDDCKITVTVDGKVAGVSQFRVRTIPRPIAIVGGFESGANVPAGAFKAQAGVGAGVKDFPFELQYKVTKFTLSADTDDGYIDDAACTGNTWSNEAKRILNGLKAGKTVMVDDIYATGPDGRSQKLPSLVYYIK